MDDCIFIATKRIPDESFWSITDQFSPDKINYLIFGDTSTHLHVHIVPKYQNGKDWGKVFLTDEPEPLFLEEDAYQSICAGLRRRLGLN